MSDALLQIRGISKSFGQTRALDDVTLTARQGEVHAVLGENGAGKSTLMKILAGALARDGGDITLAGKTAYAQAVIVGGGPAELCNAVDGTVGN